LARCDATLTFADGTNHRCTYEPTTGSKFCYLHDKYMQGLCAPIEKDSTSHEPKSDLVIGIRDSNDNRRTFDEKESA